ADERQYSKWQALHGRMPAFAVFTFSHSWAARNRSRPGTFAFRLMSFHLASNPGGCSLSIRLKRLSTKRATRRYLSVLLLQLYATRMVGTAMVSTRSPFAIRFG